MEKQKKKIHRSEELNQDVHDFAPWADFLQRLLPMDWVRGVKYYEGKDMTSLSALLAVLLTQMFLVRCCESKQPLQTHDPCVEKQKRSIKNASLVDILKVGV